MEREYRIKITGPHCGTIETAARFTWAEAQAELVRLSKNRHVRHAEIVQA